MRVPNKTEQFEFFTNEKFTPDGEEEINKEDKKDSTADDENQAADANEKTTLLMDMDDFIETVYNKSIYISHFTQKQLERKYLYMPSGKNGNENFHLVNCLIKCLIEKLFFSPA